MRRGVTVRGSGNARRENVKRDEVRNENPENDENESLLYFHRG